MTPHTPHPDPDREMLVSLTQLQVQFESIQRQLDQILTQTTRTNGRVRRLEHWRGLIVGGLSVVTVLLGWVVSVVG